MRNVTVINDIPSSAACSREQDSGMRIAIFDYKVTKTNPIGSLPPSLD